MLVPMPSPRGTNREGLYVDSAVFGRSSPQGAYDARRGLARDQDDPAAQLLTYLQDKLDPEDLAEADEMLTRWEAGQDARRRGLGRDELEPFPGRPRVGGEMDPLTEAEGRIGNLGGSEAEFQRREAEARDRRRRAEDRAVNRRLGVASDMAFDRRLSDPSGFARRFPSAGRIRVS